MAPGSAARRRRFPDYPRWNIVGSVVIRALPIPPYVVKKFAEDPVRKLIAAVGVMLLAVLASLPALAQAGPPSEAARKAELSAALQAASAAGTSGPSDIALIDQATLKLPAGFFFMPKAEGARVLRALGNVVNDEGFVGLVVGTHQND